jgi:hypothetical protein
MRTLAISANLAMILTGLVTTLVKPAQRGELPPVLAAELVKNAGEIRQLYGIGQDWHAEFVRKLRQNTIADFFFIASYGTMFFLLGRRLGGGYGLAVSAASILAAMADVVENIGILRTTCGAPSDALALWTRIPSLNKWAVLGVIWILVSRLFVNFHLETFWDPVRLLTGLLYLGGGLLCLYGLLYPGKMAWALGLVVPATIVQIVVFWFDKGFWRPTVLP